MSNIVQQSRAARYRLKLLFISLLVMSLEPGMWAMAASVAGNISQQAQSGDLAEAKRLNGQVVKLYGEGKYDEAIPIAQRALAIDEKALGPDHPAVATSLNNLALLYKTKGDYAKAEPLYQRTLAIDEKALGPDHPDVATSLNSLAALYHSKGDYAKAEPLLQRSLAIQEKALGPDHPAVALSLNNLAALFEGKGDLTRAISFNMRATDVSERNIALNLATGSERQKFLYLATLSGQTNGTISLHTRSAPTDPTALRLALTTILRRKGRALDAATDIIGALRRRLSAQDQALLDQLSDTRSRLATLMLGGPGRLAPAQYKTEIARLEDQEEKLEAQISLQSAEFKAQIQTATIERVQAAIPQSAALVEFFQFYPFDPKTSEWEAPRYVAYVLANRGEPVWADLGDAASIDALVAKLREALRDRSRHDVKDIARALDEKVMRPVRKLLGDTRRVFLSPDGALNLIPFAALVDEQNRYLVEQYSFTYLTTGRDLLRLATRLPNKQAPTVLADPDFDIGAAQSKSGPRLAGMEFESLKRLRGAEQEAIEIKATLPGATVLARRDATESAIKRVSSPALLHIATHGFFVQEAEQGPPLAGLAEARLLVRRISGSSLADQAPPGLRLENPMLKSGLFFAGANTGRSGEEDGTLTALEAAGLDLWGTKLVVLSACDTGVGEVRNGEGVYGLRRALVLAGSESQMMSLWPVSDAGTRELMIEYYKALQAGKGRSEGLRQVQLRMLTRRDREHPYYWASFIQSGEWANLDGKR